MIPLLFAGLMAIVGYSIGRKTKDSVVSGADSGLVWNPAGFWERARAPEAQMSQTSMVTILIKLVAQRMPVSPGLAQAAYQEAMQIGDVVTAQQIAVVFFPPPQQQMYQQPPPVVAGEEEQEALQETYASAEPVKATTTTFHNPAPQQPQQVSDVSPDEWREFLMCFKTRDPSYRGERHYGAFEHSTRRLSQLGQNPEGLTTEESQMSALDADLKDYMQSSERLLNDFTGESIDVDGKKVCVTRSGVLSLLKAAGPAGAKGWLTEPHQRKSFPHTTEIFHRGNGRF